MFKNFFPLLAVLFLYSAVVSQKIDWDTVVFTSMAPAEPGCVLVAGHVEIYKNFFLKDCQTTQNLIFSNAGDALDIDFTGNRDGWLLYGLGMAPFRNGKTGEVPKIGNGEWRFVGLSFYDAANGCTITSNGHVACTHDGGKMWVVTEVAAVEDVYSIAYVSKNVVWATVFSKENGSKTGCRKIIKSVDGGAKWSSAMNIRTCDLYLTGFVDDLNAWALRDNNQFLVTTDGGKKWVSVGTVPAEPDDVFFLTPRAGWAIADRNLYRTKDGGFSWKKIWTAQDHIYVDPKGLLFIDEVNGWLRGLDSLYRSNDGGVTWTRVEYPINWQ